MDFPLQFLAQAEGPGVLSTMWPILLMFAAFWFLIIAPQNKKRKEHARMITELKSGAEIVTASGIYGTITNVKDDRFVVKIAENTKIEIAKSSVGSVISQPE